MHEKGLNLLLTPRRVKFLLLFLPFVRTKFGFFFCQERLATLAAATVPLSLCLTLTLLSLE
jgi:hypothetical protein